MFVGECGPWKPEKHQGDAPVGGEVTETLPLLLSAQVL